MRQAPPPEAQPNVGAPLIDECFGEIVRRRSQRKVGLR
jgi:hypothetical protein